METDYSKHTYFRWKVKWWLEHLGALGTMGEKTPFKVPNDVCEGRNEIYLCGKVSATVT